MKAAISTYVVLQILLMSASATHAPAAIRKPKTEPAPHAGAHEIYTATEDEVDHPPAPRPLSREQMDRIKQKPATKSASTRSTAPVQVQDLPRTKQQQPGVAPKAVAAKPAAKPVTEPVAAAPAEAALLSTAAPNAALSPESFDLVPSDQAHPVIRRIHLVEEIVRRHARAYDYRTHTVRELEQILAKLDAAAPGGAPQGKPAQSAGQADPDAVPALPPLEESPGDATLPTPPNG
jgi:hypothetical protein